MVHQEIHLGVRHLDCLMMPIIVSFIDMPCKTQDRLENVAIIQKGFLYM